MPSFRRVALIGRHLLVSLPQLESAPSVATTSASEVKFAPAEIEIDVHDPAVFTAETGQRLREAIFANGLVNIRTGDAPLDKATFAKVVTLLGAVKKNVGEDES